MKALENIVTFTFEPEHGHWASDNDHIKKAKITVHVKEDIDLNAFSFTLLTRFEGTTNASYKNYDTVKITSFTSWKKGSNYEYDLDIILPQDFFIFKGHYFDINCFIKFDIIPSEDCNKRLRKQFIKEFKVGNFIDSWTSYSKQFQMAIEDNGSFKICPSVHSPYNENKEIEIVAATFAFILSLLFLIMNSFSFIALAILIGSGFYLFRGMHYLITIYRLGNVQFELYETDNDTFTCTITGDHLARLKQLDYHLSLEEETVTGGGKNQKTKTHEHYLDNSSKYQGQISNETSLIIPYPKDYSLPASFIEPGANLNWKLQIKLKLKNGITYKQEVPITLIKKLQPTNGIYNSN